MFKQRETRQLAETTRHCASSYTTGNGHDEELWMTSSCHLLWEKTNMKHTKKAWPPGRRAPSCTTKSSSNRFGLLDSETVLQVPGIYIMLCRRDNACRSTRTPTGLAKVCERLRPCQLLKQTTTTKQTRALSGQIVK